MNLIVIHCFLFIIGVTSIVRSFVCVTTGKEEYRFEHDCSNKSALAIIMGFFQSESEYDRYLWRRVEFPSASVVPSGIVDSTDGVAFLGWPNSFLISLLQPPMLPNVQSISAQVASFKENC